MSTWTPAHCELTKHGVTVETQLSVSHCRHESGAKLQLGWSAEVPLLRGPKPEDDDWTQPGSAQM